MSSDNDIDGGVVNRRRRRLLRGVAGLSAGLTGLSTVNARDDVGPGTGGRSAGADEVVFDGFRNVATGSADLQVSNDTLVVSNFDGGLDDGTCVPVGDADAFRVQTTLDDQAPVGSIRRFLGRGTVDGESGRTMGFADVKRIDSPDGYAIQPNFQGIGADAYGVQLFDDGELVYEAEELTEPTTVEFPEVTPTVGTDTHLTDVIEICWKWVWTGRTIWLVMCIEINLPFVFPTGDRVVGNEIRFVPVRPLFTPGPFSECDVFGFGLNRFVIFSEAFGTNCF